MSKKDLTEGLTLLLHEVKVEEVTDANSPCFFRERTKGCGRRKGKLKDRKTRWPAEETIKEGKPVSEAS